MIDTCIDDSCLLLVSLTIVVSQLLIIGMPSFGIRLKEGSIHNGEYTSYLGCCKALLISLPKLGFH